MSQRYNISGNERKELKQLLNEMKEYLQFLNTEHDKLKVDIASLEIKLNEKYERNKIQR